jgi:hypothetical protein
MRHLQLSPISHSQSLHCVEIIPVHSPAISPPPKEFSSISNPPPSICSYFSSSGSSDQLTGNTDSDGSNDSGNRKSRGGHDFLLNNGAVLWQSQKEDLDGISTVAAEYTVCSEGSREAMRLLHLPGNNLSKDASPLLINCDNQSPLSHITTGIIKVLTTHIDVC